jgi:membrane-bound lytic murein transglycosylase D
MKILVTGMIILFLTGCSFSFLARTEIETQAVSEFPTQQEQIEPQTELETISIHQTQLDSLYLLIEGQLFTIDSLCVALELANSRVAVNQNFIIPDSLVFAGRTFHMKNERILDKFEEIFEQELQAAHRFIPLSGKYFSYFDSVFTKHNVPLDAKYLAIAESRLNPMATSRVGAAGTWQFMPRTGKGFGLKIDDFVDERRHIMESTEAAAAYLKNNYYYLKERGIEDWLLAMSAYNAGAGSITKVAKEQGANDFFDLILRVDETNRYVWRAAAIKLIFDNEEAIFGQKFERQAPLFSEVRREKLKLNGHYKIDEWAQYQGTSLGKIWEYNPWIKIFQRKRVKYSAVNDVILSPGEYTVFVPLNTEKNELKLAQLEQTFLQKNEGYFSHHTVKKGETLFVIAKRYKTTVNKIKSLNNLKSDVIYPGQKLKLRGSVTKEPYIVKRGDSVHSIARKLGVSSSHLITTNNLKNTNGIIIIHPGQRLHY